MAFIAGVPRGRDKKNTIAHLSRAISDGKLNFKSLVTISVPQTAGLPRTLFVKKFRSYKPDSTIVLPGRPSFSA